MLQTMIGNQISIYNYFISITIREADKDIRFFNSLKFSNMWCLFGKYISVYNFSKLFNTFASVSHNKICMPMITTGGKKSNFISKRSKPLYIVFLLHLFVSLLKVTFSVIISFKLSWPRPSMHSWWIKSMNVFESSFYFVFWWHLIMLTPFLFKPSWIFSFLS